MNLVPKGRWNLAPFAEVVGHSAFGPRFGGECYAADGNVATLRTTDISEDGTISYDGMPRAQLDESRFSGHFLVPGDLVVTRSGRVGTSAVFSGFDGLVLPGAFLLRFRLKATADSRFYRYYFNSFEGRQQLLSVAKGAAQQNITITSVEALLVPVPPLSTQQRIANVLSAYDDLIENNRRRMALLEDAARQFYREWFVRLRFPGHEHTRIVDGVPEAWERVPLGDRVVLNYGKALKAEDRADGPHPVYGSSGVVGRHDAALVSAPGIVVGRKGNVGSVFWCSKDYWPIDTVYFVDAESTNLWLYYALAHLHFISTDVAVPGLNREFAYSRLLLVPPHPVIREFLNAVGPMHQQISLLDEMNEKLRSGRNLLLPRLMSGEIEV